MHLGVARTFLVAWLDARAHDGRLLLRIEDLDGPRTVEGADARIMRDLEWLGLGWDGAPTWQSKRGERYLEALSALGRRSYPCTCSRKEIREASAPHGPGDDGPRYPGTCRDGAKDRPDRTPSVRFRTEPGDLVAHEDRALGSLDEDVFSRTGDFVLRRADGLWAYQHAVTVDDLDQGVSCIVRGDDLAGSTPRQLLLRGALSPSAPPIETLHVPLLLDAEGQRMAKRHQSLPVAALREAGEPSEAVIGRLAASLGWVPEGTRTRAEALVELWKQACASPVPTSV